MFLFWQESTSAGKKERGKGIIYKVEVKRVKKKIHIIIAAHIILQMSSMVRKKHMLHSLTHSHTNILYIIYIFWGKFIFWCFIIGGHRMSMTAEIKQKFW